MTTFREFISIMKDSGKELITSTKAMTLKDWAPAIWGVITAIVVGVGLVIIFWVIGILFKIYWSATK